MPETSTITLTALSASSPTSSTSSVVSQRSTASNSKTKAKRFDLEEEEENWPAVDVGNLIIDLDADIDGSSSSAMSSSAGSSNAKGGMSKNLSSSTSGGSSGHNVSGGSQTTTVTEQPSKGADQASSSSAAAAAAAEKGLKMKIKRTKTGSNRNPEGKLEIVQSAQNKSGQSGGEGGLFVNGHNNKSNIASEVSSSAPLSAADVVNAVTAAAKQGKGTVLNNGGKVKLTGGGKTSVTNGAAPSVNGNGQECSGEPAAKRQKVGMACLYFAL